MPTDLKAADACDADEVTLAGVAICPGIGSGHAHVVDREIVVPEYVIEIIKGELENE